jgi:hypothetical protein
MTEPQRCAIYRCFDADGVLLYVGCSRNPERRMDGHRSRSTWASQVARRADEWFPTVEAALGAEYMAIVDENPLHNRKRLRVPEAYWMAALESRLDAQGQLYYYQVGHASGRVFKMNRLTGCGRPASRTEAAEFWRRSPRRTCSLRDGV